jgi:glycosyltransferase involved in cell wall biosynthesis
LADSTWQLEWIKENVGVEVGVAFGGINLSQFMPGNRKRTQGKKLVVYSNDPRERKGPETIKAAVEIIRKHGNADIDSYWNRRLTQTQLVNFLQGADVFIDAHRRGGWCNPVIEAMACGTATVCTDIGATRDFAQDGVTSLVVPVDDPQALADAAFRLLRDDALRQTLVRNGLERVQQFSYTRVGPRLAAYLERQLQAQVREPG